MPEYTQEQIDEAKKLLIVSAAQKSTYWVGREPIPETVILSALSAAEQERDALKTRCAELEARLQGAAERFSVIDKLTGQEPDIEEIALHRAYLLRHGGIRCRGRWNPIAHR